MYKAPKRTLDIVRLRDKGWSFKKLSKKYELSYGRTREVYFKYKKRLLVQVGWGKLEIREINALKRAGYNSLKELKDNFKTVKIKNIGEGTIKKINYYLKKL